MFAGGVGVELRARSVRTIGWMSGAIVCVLSTGLWVSVLTVLKGWALFGLSGVNLSCALFWLGVVGLLYPMGWWLWLQGVGRVWCWWGSEGFWMW